MREPRGSAPVSNLVGMDAAQRVHQLSEEKDGAVLAHGRRYRAHEQQRPQISPGRFQEEVQVVSVLWQGREWTRGAVGQRHLT